MHGWIIGSLEKMIIEKHGKMTYERVKAEANCDVATGSWVLLELYPDRYIFDLIDAACKIINMDKELIMEEVGRTFMHQVREMGYANLLNCHGTTLRSWLENVNLLHDHLQSTMPVEQFLFPEIYCIDNPSEEKESFIVQYYSPRGIMYKSFLIGIIHDAAEYYFNIKVSLELIATQGEGSKFTCFILRKIASMNPSPEKEKVMAEQMDVSEIKTCPFSGVSIESPRQNTEPTPLSHSGDGMSAAMLKQVFPFFIKFDSFFNISDCGDQLEELLHIKDQSEHQKMSDYFEILKPPHCQWTWLEIQQHSRTPFEIIIKKNKGNGDVLGLIGGLYLEQSGFEQNGFLLVQPAVYTLAEMVQHNLTWDSAIPRHSLQRRLIMVGEHLKSEAYMNRESQLEAADKKRSLEMKRLFVRYVSHEIRNPLNTVSLGLELIQSLKSFSTDKLLQNALQQAIDAKDPEAIEAATTSIEALASIFDMTTEVKESCDIAVSILNDLLLYEKIEGGLLALECRTQPAVDLLFDTARTFAIQGRANKIELQCVCDPTKFPKDELSNPSVFIHVDRPKFTQVIRNLLSNAMKFSPENSVVKLNVTTVVKSSGGVNEERSPSKTYVRAEVHDSGAGISPENIKKLFGNIIQFDSEKLQGGGGSGIGLFVSKGIMDLHQGFIGVNSEGIGHGSVFFVEVPILGTSEKEARQSAKEDQPMFSAWIKGRMNSDQRKPSGEQRAEVVPTEQGVEVSQEQVKKVPSSAPSVAKSRATSLDVLLVDDSSATRKMVSRYLRMSKVCLGAHEANDGDVAVEVVKKSIQEHGGKCHYDVILMDHIMPNVEGPAAAKQIRDLGYNGLLIGLTGQLQPEEQEMFKSHGANHVLAKPVDLKVLRGLLEDCMAAKLVE